MKKTNNAKRKNKGGNELLYFNSKGQRVRRWVKRSIQIPRILNAALVIQQVLEKKHINAWDENILVKISGLHIGYWISHDPIPREDEDIDTVNTTAAERKTYHIDIWDKTKVLNLQFKNSGGGRILSFRRGDWEEKLLSIAEKLKKNSEIETDLTIFPILPTGELGDGRC